MREWPLILFTLAVQLACGLTLAATLSDARLRGAEPELMRPLAIAIFPAIAGGILVSMAHLGQPRRWWRSLSNVRQSRLSREVMLTAVFALLALAYSGFWWLERTEGRLILGVATGAAGIASVVAGAAIYTVPAKPVWNSGWVPASFLGTTFLLGGLVPAALFPANRDAGLERILLSAAVAGSLLLLFAVLWMLANLARFAGLAKLFLPMHAVWLGCHLALASLLPAAVIWRLWDARSLDAGSASLVVAAVLIGSAIGRGLMYWLGTHSEPF